jgi:hypothetical protein
MISDPFNVVSGLSAGIPAVQVIDSNGNIVSNFLNLSGNVAAGTIYSDNYKFANGANFTTSAGGSNTQLQYNNNGSFAGIPNVTFNGTILNLGNINTLSIGGGLNGYFLQTDGSGNLTWAEGGGGGGNGSPGGANTQVQFNDSGSFGGDVGFTYNKTTDILNVTNIVVSANVIANKVSATGNISANYFIGNGSQLTGVTLDVANFVSQSNQANITQLGNLVSLNVDGTITGLANLNISDNISATSLNLASEIAATNGTFTNKVTIGSNLTVNTSAILRVVGNVNTAGSANINLGTVSNIHISGGTNGYVLATDGLGNLSWVAQSGGGGNGNPGGTNTQVQFNNNDTFGGSPFLTYNDFTRTLQVGGNLVANSLQMGAGAYKWSTSQVYFATTSSVSPQQVLYSVPVSEISGVEFEIIATDNTGLSRQFCKISSLYYNGTVEFTEYASLFVNGGVGNFEVDYNAGNIITPSSLELKVTPSTSHLTNYKMLITSYAP